jgi:probable phosphoglycerate mutase
MAETTELVLVRHGQAVDNVEFLANLTSECRGLTEHGHEQARTVARRLAAAAPFHVLCHSPVRRAAQTARHIAAALGPDVPVEEVAGLRVADHGEHGRHPWDPKTNLIGTIPPLDPMTVPSPGAESWQAYLDRSGRTLAQLAERHAGRRILVVAHSETAASALHAFMRLPQGASRWTFPHISHTGLSGWRHTVRRFRWPSPPGCGRCCIRTTTPICRRPNGCGTARPPEPPGGRPRPQTSR